MTKNRWTALIPLGTITLITTILAFLLYRASGFEHNISPIFISLGPIQIRYYGLVYFAGFLVIYLVLRQKTKNNTLPLPEESLVNFILYSILGVIVGARIFEVIFYHPSYYLSNPIRILKIWEGGLSFHGALCGAIVTAWLFTRKRKTQFLQLTDELVMPILIFLALGRFANFINGELYGSITDLGWGVKFKDAIGYRHPTQLYETIKNLFSFGVLFFMRSFKPRQGTLSFSFLILYGAFRFLIEFLKNYKKYGYSTLGSLAGLNIAQILCLVMVIAGIWGVIAINKSRKNKSNEKPLDKNEVAS